MGREMCGKGGGTGICRLMRRVALGAAVGVDTRGGEGGVAVEGEGHVGVTSSLGEL
jgi:hypothetical protein